MKQVSIIIMLIMLGTGCTKRDFIYQDKMWDILSRGNGIWLLEKKELLQINSDGSTDLIIANEPNQTKYYFYTKVTSVLGETIENKYLEITTYNEVTGVHSFSKSYFLSSLTGGAENERITLENPSGGVAKVYTVEKRGRKKQRWQFITNNTAVPQKEILNLKKCNSCTPDILGPGIEVTE